MRPDQAFRACEHCARPYSLDARAPHKRFCSSRCRMAWHQAQRQQAVTAFRKAAYRGTYQCQLCEQIISDSRPCGCGAREQSK